MSEDWKRTYVVDATPVKPLRVLVAEDDGLLAEVMVEVLEAMGHSVCACESSEDGAVAAAFQSEPDLMIVDVRLGRGSGISVVDKIRRKLLIPHIFVTGDIKGLRALLPGAEALEKPFRDDDLERSIRRVTGSAEVR